ncbi:BQ2448_3869 [Microbotryum intermedium]|uniref:BQ2448_3869 protein n=1 Tax=Microbotryum intermedium TaxID=269621 RepID=A0A238FET1_9BASI|nr:BQ2448_3869 [Microbotryum intermedium]
MTASSLFGSDEGTDEGSDATSAEPQPPSSSQGLDGRRTLPPPPDPSSTPTTRTAPGGLYHFPHAIPIELQTLLVQNITTALPLSMNQNQLMYFKHLPPALDPLLSHLEAELATYNLPTEILDDLMGHPNSDRQAIINLYGPGMGIAPHVDLPHRYSSVILGVSLLGTTVMDFVLTDDPGKRFEMVIRPGDVYVLSGQSRYVWTHGIELRHSDWIDGEERKRGLRISVTLRRMKEGGHVVGAESAT